MGVFQIFLPSKISSSGSDLILLRKTLKNYSPISLPIHLKVKCENWIEKFPESLNVKSAMVESHLTGCFAYILWDLVFYYGIISSDGLVI